MYRKWTATIKEQEKDRLTPVSTRVPLLHLSFRTFLYPMMPNFIMTDCWSIKQCVFWTWLLSGMLCHLSPMQLFLIFLRFNYVFPSAVASWIASLVFTQPKDAVDISLKDIDQLAKSSFPLCMRHMLDKVRHLKYSYRHTYLATRCLNVFIYFAVERKPPSEAWRQNAVWSFS
jgi:hypothetical protein